MSLTTAITRAYSTMKERDWDTIYWAIDLHGTCIKSSYASNGLYEWLSEESERVMKWLASLPETKIIIWSSLLDQDVTIMREWFSSQGIPVYINENPLQGNTAYADFSKKFYFSVLLDDKAGFEPSEDWNVVENVVATCRKEMYESK